MKISGAVVILAALMSPAAALEAQKLDVNPGTERWAVKTSLAKDARSFIVPLSDLLSLAAPIARPSEAPESSRIQKTVGPDGLREGDIVTTTAWLHLVALERDSKHHRDGDYHIQLRRTDAWGDSCLIVEVPYPEFVQDPVLRACCDSVRTFIKEKLLSGKEPGTRGNILAHPVPVTLRGQLFFDAPHLRNDGTVSPRGKKGGARTPMSSYTAWEIHPVTGISFAPKAK
jgi:hypothetical protein